MLRFPKFPIFPGQHIIPPHVKYIVITTIIIFALFSSHIPAFSILYAKSNYRDSRKITPPKKIEEIVVTKAPIKNAVIVKSAAHTNVPRAANKEVPQPTKKSEEESKITPMPKLEVKAAVSTPTPTAVPTSTPQVMSNVSAPSDAKGQLLAALNAYRQKKGKNALSWNANLAGFAQGRAEQFDRDGKMDNHAGFHELTSNDGFNRMGFLSLAENSSYGDTRDPIFIIENLYGQSPGHDANQLSSDYTHVGIGASGKATDLLFGGRKK